MVWSASEEALGIGTSSLSSYSVQDLVINNTGNNVGITIQTDATGMGKIHFADGTSGSELYRGVVRYQHSSDTMDFWTAGTAKMTLDNSGNLLVGHTSQYSPIGDGGSGVTLNANGQIFAGGQYPSYFNLEDADGDIVIFRKDGTTVGSIGVADSGDRIYLAGGGLEGVGIDNSANAFVPTSEAGAFKDNHLSLGTSSARFEDLYLSGGVYLGGTGSANKLDDYEEGTFTPSIGFNNNTSGITFSATPQGAYTKVGRKVTVIITFAFTNKGSTSGNFTCSLPFTSIGSGQGSGVMGYNYNWVNGDKARGFTFQVHSGVLYMMNANSGAFATNGEFNNNTYVSGITVTYFTS
jgi:hypothetical protein